MVLEISPEVYKWLQGLSLVKDAKRNQNNLMEVSEETANRLMDGFVLGPLLRTFLTKKTDDDKLKKIEALK